MKLGSDPRSQLVLSVLERNVLLALADAMGEFAEGVQAQCGSARVINRSHSGVGFVTRLEIPEEIPSLPAGAERRTKAVYAHHPELGEPAEFLVQIRDGRLTTIEAFAPEGMWPADDSAFRIGATHRG